MTLLALGINHKTAPVSLRERVTFSPESIDEALTSLLQQPLVQGGVVLSTCNRTELYLSVEQQEHMHEQLVALAVRLPQPAPGRGEEKPVLASGQRRGQPFDAGGQRVGLIGAGRTADPRAGEKAFAESQRGQSLSGELERLFQKSFSVAKRVRTETDIGASAVSVAFCRLYHGAPDLRIVGRSQRLAGGRR